MHDDHYCLTYLPIFSHDLNQAYDYINDVLHNPDAADSLINAVEAAIEKRLPNCESFEQYHSIKQRRFLVYRIYVKDYTIFYVVRDDQGPKKVMEVQRFLYNGRNHQGII